MSTEPPVAFHTVNVTLCFASGHCFSVCGIECAFGEAELLALAENNVSVKRIALEFESKKGTN